MDFLKTARDCTMKEFGGMTEIAKLFFIVPLTGMLFFIGSKYCWAQWVLLLKQTCLLSLSVAIVSKAKKLNLWKGDDVPSRRKCLVIKDPLC